MQGQQAWRAGHFHRAELLEPIPLLLPSIWNRKITGEAWYAEAHSTAYTDLFHSKADGRSGTRLIKHE